MTDVATDRVRIMKFLTVFECGGTERQGLNLGIDLMSRGFDVRFGCLRQSGRLLREINAHHIPVQEYRIRSLYSPRAALKATALARDLVRDRVEIVHAYNLYGNVFAVPAARLAGVPVVIAAVRDCGVYLDAWKRRVQRWACRVADVVLVNADGVKRWLVSDGCPADRIVVIRNGIDLSRFDPSADEGDVRTELGIPADAPVISTTARLCPTKGFEDAIDAMATIHQSHPDARLLVIGEGLKSARGELSVDGTYRSQLEARARALGLGDRVLFLGYRADVPRILRQVTVAMQPSLTEGLSNSILESMAAGRAVVATPVGGTPEVIRHDETGLLTPVRDPRRLGANVSSLLADEGRRRALGAAARRHVEAELSIPAMVNATERLYRRLLEKRRNARTKSSREPAVRAM